MGSQSQPKIPVIDMSNESLKPGARCNEIRHAFEEIGCFEAIYREVPLELHNNVFATAAELFGLPNEIKMKNKSTKTYFDYFGQYASLPLYESLAIDNPTSLESTQSFTTLMWPAGYQGFCHNVYPISKPHARMHQRKVEMGYPAQSGVRHTKVALGHECFTAWSNDRIRPCWHKVNMTASETRISMGLFSFISGTVNIPEEFADDTWPLRYKPFNHFGYLRFNSEAEPKGLPSTLKDYCGM
ncbi:hypothetical protein Patl1_34370 [Pistacia atlantica]|uniref:Uncharacterized protein n=1 Tax=Pistacia atlantica TaxID=434234 RepID=A0ACC0ZUX5_9ROSI|nr:hypothetical protein Patl1_34370 [Pistacia atlantica]